MNDSKTQTAGGHFPTFRRLFGWVFSWRTIRRCLFVLACLVTLLALYCAEENWRGRHAWNNYRQELEAPGERWHAKDNYARTSSMVKGLKNRAEYIDLVAWGSAFAAVRSGNPAPNRK